ncbi:hypothetical protein [Pelagibaculum spongiae]|uniref:hypothetical protein n=1 Tax=Pelagibaculum spongiae TaxID=2080658 RepID=UPI001057A40A|nr:hypothetical protein [Pelagibaculum spongiae]
MLEQRKVAAEFDKKIPSGPAEYYTAEAWKSVSFRVEGIKNMDAVFHNLFCRRIVIDGKLTWMPPRPSATDGLSAKLMETEVIFHREYINFISSENVISETFEICSLVIEHFPPDQYCYIGIGSSPLMIIPGLQALAPEATSCLIPFCYTDRTIKDQEKHEVLDISEDQRKNLQAHFSYFISKAPNKKVLIIDKIATGASLFVALGELGRYFGGAEVEGLALISSLYEKEDIDFSTEYISKSFGTVKTSFLHPIKLTIFSELMENRYIKALKNHPQYRVPESPVPTRSPPSLTWLALKAVIELKFAEISKGAPLSNKRFAITRKTQN